MEENLVTNPETNSSKKISLKFFARMIFISETAENSYSNVLYPEISEELILIAPNSMQVGEYLLTQKIQTI